MKRRLILCAILALIFIPHEKTAGLSRYDDELEAFLQLPAEEKIQKMLEEFRYDQYYSIHPKYVQFERDGFNDNNNIQEIIPVLLDYFEKTEMIPPLPIPPGGYEWNTPLRFSDNSYRIINSIVSSYIIGRHFNQDEAIRVKLIYQNKIHTYLATYKVVDVNVILAEIRIDNIDEYDKPRGPRSMINLRDKGDALYKKYTQLGYRDLRVNYMGIR